jgi:hypothetical protein
MIHAIMKNAILLVTSLVLTLGLSAQAQLLNETFGSAAGFSISDSNGTSTFFSDGSNDYFGIYDGNGDGGADFGSSTVNPSGAVIYTNIADNYLVNEDIDGEGPTPPMTLTWSGIPLSGETALQISADFASTRADGGDYVVISYRVDGGAWTGVLGVGGQSGEFNTTVYEITDFSSNFGDANATALSAAFTTISNTFSLSGTESTLDIKAEFSNDNGDDNFGLDNLVVVEAVADTAPPEIDTGAGTTPADGDTNVVRNVEITIPFNEDIQAGTGSIGLYQFSNDSLVEAFNVATSDVSISGSTVTFRPSSFLAAGTQYYVLIGSEAITDLAGNATVELAAKGDLDFTTGSSVTIRSDAIGTVTVEDGDLPADFDTDSFYSSQAGEVDGDNTFDEYSLAEFTIEPDDFQGLEVTDISQAILALTVNDRSFSTSGDYLIYFTTDSKSDLTTSVDYDALAWDGGSTYGFDPTDFTDAPVSAVGGVQSFDAAAAGGEEDLVTLDLTSIKSDLISAFNSGDSFHLMIVSPDTGGAVATYSGQGNTFDPGDPRLQITAELGSEVDGLVITETGESTDVEEGGATDTFQVALNTEPVSGLQVDVIFDPDDELDLGSGAGVAITLNFTSGNFTTSQTVNVTAVDDSDIEGTHVGNISISTSTSDSGYTGITDNLSVNITDNDLQNIFINEVDAQTPGTDAAEFVELYSPDGSISLDGLVVVFFNGNGDIAYDAFDLDGYSTDANGFFLIANSGVTGADITFSNNGLQNGVDAVAIYQGNASDFSSGTPATSSNLIDAVVYDDGGGTDSGLEGTLIGGESTVSENSGSGGADNDSIARVPDGGTPFDTSEFVAQTPTPGTTNSPVDPPDITVSVLGGNSDTFSEADGSTATVLQISVPSAPGSDLSVTVTSADSSEATVALSPVTILADETSTTVNIDAVDDMDLDGSQTVTITASATGYDNGTIDLTVTDDEVPGTDGPIYISQYYQNSFEAWIEICNTSGSPVSLSGYNLAIWSLDGANPEGWKTDTGTAPNVIDLSILTVPANGTVLIRGFLTSAPTYAVADVDLTATFSEMPSLSGGESVALYDGTVTVSNVVDVVSITAADTAIGISIVRIAEGTGFDLTSGSSYTDYPAIWSIVGTAPNYTDSISSVDNAPSSDNIYLGTFDFGTASGFDTYISGQTGAGGDGQDDDKNGDGIDNKTSYAFDLQNDGTTTTGAGSGRPYNQLFDSAFVDDNVPATPDDITDDRFGFVFETPSNVPSDVTITVSVSSTIGGTPTTIATYTAAGGWAEANGGTVIPDPQDSNKVIIYDSQAISAASSRFMSFDVTIN